MTTLDLDLLAQSDKALEHFKKGELFLAKDICYDNLVKNSHHAPTLNLLGIILFKEGNSEKGIEHLKNAIKYSLDKSKEYSFNLAKIYQAIKQYTLAINTFISIEEFGLAADLYFIQNNFELAKNYLKKELEKYPSSALLYNKLGVICSIEENYLEAKDFFEKSIALDNKNCQAYNNLGSALHKLKEFIPSKLAFEKAIELNPNYCEALNHKGMLLSDLNLNDESKSDYLKSLEINPQFENARYNLGNLYIKLGLIDDAIICFDAIIKQNPNYYNAYIGLGNCYKVKRKDKKSIEYFEKALTIHPHSSEAKNHLLTAYQMICEWDNFEKLNESLKEESSLNHLILLKAISRTMDLAYLLKVAKSTVEFTKEAVKPFKKTYNFITSKEKKRIHIGYLSCDFHNHATAHLFTGVLEHHNKNDFEVSIYSYGIDDQSEYRKRIIQAVSNFHDVRELKFDEVAEKIFADKIDILIDLKGYTQDARLEICALKPAPIQITYLGFPGTSGADFFDYLITDKVVTPKEHLPYYTETPIYMPSCYQANDNKQPVSARFFSKADCQLPDDHFIFCSFNQAYKIEPIMFSSWMNILKKVPKSSLWLLKNNDESEHNLKNEAKKRGVDPSRLIFADKLTKDEHLSRLRNADLMLDTRIYNGHTTTSDALWSEVLVITVEGSHFASKVSTSILTAIGLNQLVCKSQEAFEELAVKIATEKGYCDHLKDLLRKNKLTTPLFDTKQFTLDLEERYKKAFKNYCDGKNPEIIE